MMEYANLNMKKIFGLFGGIIVMALIIMMPAKIGLPIVGQRLLAILAFAIVIWMTEAIPYSISAVIITTLMILLMGTAPVIDDPYAIIGSKNALGIALSGFSSSALALVASALVIALSMSKTGLDKRIALRILSMVGTKTSNILIGSLLVGTILAFFVPSTTARVSCLVPIMFGIVHAFNIDEKSRFSGMLMIAAAQMSTFWNIGIATGGAQNFVALSYIEQEYNVSVSWLDWFIAGAPFSLIMGVVLYFVMLFFMKPEIKHMPGNVDSIKDSYKALGKMTVPEKKLLVTSILLLFAWSTQGVLHSFDTASCTIVALAYLLFPVVGVLKWKNIQENLSWGTLILFGVGISLGNALLDTGAASWLANEIADIFNIGALSIFGMIAILSLFLILIHLGFASATALTASMIPIMIAIFNTSSVEMNPVGMVLIMQFVVSFGFILPVNSPQNMVVYATNTFRSKDFIKIGLVLTLISYGVVLLLSKTYWQWIELI